MQGADDVKPGPRVAGAGGVELATYHLGGDGPPLIAMHATGFHGRCWIPLAPYLTDTFSVWSLDQRGHGSSGKAPDGRYDDWNLFVDDLLLVLDALGGGPWRGFGHSLGGAVLLLAEARRPGTFVDLCCYEPVVMQPDLAPREGTDRAVPLAQLARKRRPSFPSRQAAYDNYASKPPFNRFDPAALEAYVEFGFVDGPDGTVVLACEREAEASTFDGAPSAGAWAILPDVRCPVAVLGGGDESDPVGLMVDPVARRLPRGGGRHFTDLDHFGPFQDPGRVGTVAAAALGSTKSVTPPS